MTGSDKFANGGRNYHAGVAVACLTSFLTVWTTVVRDDGHGIGFFLLIMAAGVGGFAAGFRPEGMARTMLGVAVMQAMLGLAIATAPVTASIPGAVFRIVLFSGVFMLLWLISAAFFHAATRADRESAAR